ncbi:hypothetical protein GCM10023205_27030 [Yinghuangia aomiensis]|uniref:Effector-associated domain-containing protein n=1 Tax=Yinghuangia aomiensis TaxID=676205 RepID=A0ABP9H4J8_9ACTN
MREFGGSASPGAAPWRVRVWSHGGAEIAGAGVLLPDGAVLTCAHVVEAAFGLRPESDPPDGAVPLDFPGVPGGPASVGGTPRVLAHVAPGGWLRKAPAGDLAVLRLAGPPPPGAVPPALGRCGDGSAGADGGGAPVLVFGHPRSVPGGLWSRGRVVAAGGSYPDWRQVDGLDAVGAAVERGFSGAGVWDQARGLVTGVLAEVFEGTAARVSWMIPLDTLDGTAFALPPRSAPRPSSAPPPAPLPPAAIWPLVDLLLAVESFRVDGGADLLSVLPSDIAATVPRSRSPRLGFFQIVARCDAFVHGPRALVDAVRQIEGDTAAAADFTAHARRAWPTRVDDDG